MSKSNAREKKRDDHICHWRWFPGGLVQIQMFHMVKRIESNEYNMIDFVYYIINFDILYEFVSD